MEKATFKEAVQKFIHIGEVYFRGHYNDNVLNIFNELPEEDRKVLLRTLYQVYFLVERGEIENPLDVAQRRSENVPEDKVVTASMTASSTFIIASLLVLLFVLVSLFFIVGLDPNSGTTMRTLFKLLEFVL